ncbi:MAG: hypothetical protein NPIRA06_03540 [Nitrospirales bacterium]|nr:MAG: hypothetical protein NPIRA06_03540 [Nitrospirales bacterium]
MARSFKFIKIFLAFSLLCGCILSNKFLTYNTFLELSVQSPNFFSKTPDEEFLYVFSKKENEFLIYDWTSKEPIQKFPSNLLPDSLIFNGDFAYLLGRTTPEGSANLLKINIKKNFLSQGSINLGSSFISFFSTLSADGKTLYLSNVNEPFLILVDTASLKIDKKIPLSHKGVLDVEISHDESRAYVTHGFSPIISVIDLNAKKQIASINQIGKMPSGLALNSEGTLLYVADNIDPLVTIIDINNNKKIDEVRIHENPKENRKEKFEEKGFFKCCADLENDPIHGNWYVLNPYMDHVMVFSEKDNQAFGVFPIDESTTSLAFNFQKNLMAIGMEYEDKIIIKKRNNS